LNPIKGISKGWASKKSKNEFHTEGYQLDAQNNKNKLKNEKGGGPKTFRKGKTKSKRGE